MRRPNCETLRAPAIAKTTLSNGKQLCEAPAKGITPASKNVQVDDHRTKVSDASLVHQLKTKNADDSIGGLVRNVDRETGVSTIGS